MYIINQLKLKEEEIKEINKKIEILKKEISSCEYLKNENKKDIKYELKLALKTIPILTIIRFIYELYTNSFNMDFYTGLQSGGKYLLYYTLAFVILGIPTSCFYVKNNKKISKLNNELTENQELLSIRTKSLEELKSKNNETNKDYINYDYKNINSINNLKEEKINSKIRIRKR